LLPAPESSSLLAVPVSDRDLFDALRRQLSLSWLPLECLDFLSKPLDRLSVKVPDDFFATVSTSAADAVFVVAVGAGLVVAAVDSVLSFKIYSQQVPSVSSGRGKGRARKAKRHVHKPQVDQLE
jgi:hypothetical protein